MQKNQKRTHAAEENKLNFAFDLKIVKEIKTITHIQFQKRK